jgi:hypothetical protein
MLPKCYAPTTVNQSTPCLVKRNSTLIVDNPAGFLRLFSSSSNRRFCLTIPGKLNGEIFLGSQSLVLHYIVRSQQWAQLS